jgi:hypothetical protein
MGTQKFRGHDNKQPFSLEFVGPIAGKKKKTTTKKKKKEDYPS